MVTEPQTSTPMQEWVAQALERMKPILDGPRHVYTDGETEEDMIRDTLERVEWLAQHFKVLPEPCCDSTPCHLTAYAEGHSAGYLEAMLWARNKVRDMRMEAAPEQRATWDVHPHEEDEG